MLPYIRSRIARTPDALRTINITPITTSWSMAIILSQKLTRSLTSHVIYEFNLQVAGAPDNTLIIGSRFVSTCIAAGVVAIGPIDFARPWISLVVVTVMWST